MFKTKRFGHEASACICYKNTVALIMLLNTFEMCCMGKVFFMFYFM
jgi:hypothetical protein